MKRRKFFTAAGALLFGSTVSPPKGPTIIWDTPRPKNNKILVNIDELEKLAKEAGRNVLITRKPNSLCLARLKARIIRDRGRGEMT